MSLFNSLLSSDDIWPGSTLAQVMAWCLTAPSHYLNQCWLLISEVLWHTLDSKFKGVPKLLFGITSLKIILSKSLSHFPGGQWIKLHWHACSWWPTAAWRQDISFKICTIPSLIIIKDAGGLAHTKVNISLFRPGLIHLGLVLHVCIMIHVLWKTTVYS